MADNFENANDFIAGETILTLTDSVTGEEREFLLLAKDTFKGQLYFVLDSGDEEDEGYGIVKVIDDGNEFTFEGIDDDDVIDYFNDLFFNEVDYDAE